MSQQEDESSSSDSSGAAATVATPTAGSFVLRVARGEDDQLAIEARGPAGQAAARVPVPPGFRPAGPAEDDTDWWAIARQQGSRLFAAAFPPDIVHLLEESRLRAGDAALPVVLEVADPDLTTLPWELLRDPDTERFVALSEHTLLSRRRPEDADLPEKPAAQPHADALHVHVLLNAGDADLSLAEAIGAVPGLDVTLAGQPGVAQSAPDVLQLAAPLTQEAVISASVKLVVVRGGIEEAMEAAQRVGSVVALPNGMAADAVRTFLTTLYARLAAGEPLDRSVGAARRAVASNHTIVALTWSLPVLLSATPSAPVLTRKLGRPLVKLVGEKAKTHTVSWLRNVVTGVISSVVLFLFGLTLFRLGFSQSPDFSISIVSPYSLFQSFKGLVIELSTYQEHFLLIAAAVLVLATATITAVWLRHQKTVPAHQPPAGASRLVGHVANLRTVSFLAVASLTVFGADLYQQYLWRVQLPIPQQSLGIAVTREVAASSFRAELADSLFSKGQAQQIVIRELPVAFDARDTGTARALGKRIGAKAVIIYRSERPRTGSGPRYVAYVVFTDPTVGLTIAAAPQGSQAGGAAGLQAGAMVRMKEGIEVPVLRTETLEELVSAAAGIIAYQEDRPRTAISQLKIALPKDAGAPNTGIVNFYLGNAYDLDEQSGPAIAAYERAAGFYAGRQQQGEQLGPQDELLLVKTYSKRGQLAAFADDWDGAIAWYQKANALQADLLARASGLERPSDVHAAYARLFTQLADAYRGQSLGEEEQYWRKRAGSEIDALLAASDRNDPETYIQVGAAQFFLGTCVDASTSLNRALGLDPTNVEALNDAEVVAFAQGRPDLARVTLQRIIATHPNDVQARQQLANLLKLQGLGADYVDFSYLQQAEAQYQEIIKLDPANLDARQEIAQLADLRASGMLTDVTALFSDDKLVATKSQNAWPADPKRFQAALDALGTAIEERRILASELMPGDNGARVALAEAYGHRQQVYFSALPASVEPTTAASVQVYGDQIVADSARIRDWTGQVLAEGSGATREDRLRAAAARVAALEREWGWHAFYAHGMLGQDDSKAKALEVEYRQAVADALLLIEASPVATPDAATAAAHIYLSAGFVAAALDQDSAKGTEYQQKAQGLADQSFSGQARSTAHLETFCVETREKSAGDAAIAQGDYRSAQQHYEAAITANHEHAASLAGLALALYSQGDVSGAVLNARTASQITPDDPLVWSRLGLYDLVAGDQAAREDAYRHALDAAGKLPAQARLAAVRTMIADLRDLNEKDRQMAPRIREVLPLLVSGLGDISVGTEGSYQYAERYAELGSLALFSDDAQMATSLLRRAVALDPHQPMALADLTLAVIAQGHDPSQEIAATIQETRDQLWSSGGEPSAASLLEQMAQEAERYEQRFPGRSAALQPFNQAVAAERANQKT